MTTYGYRVRVDTTRGRLPSTGEDEYHEIRDPSDHAARLTIRDGQGRRPQSIIVTGSGFETSEEASDAGRQVKRVLVVAGVLADVPIVPGKDSATSGPSQFLRDKIRTDTGTDLRADVHGVDVFPDSDRPVYMRMEGDGYATVPVDHFLEALGTAVSYEAELAGPKHLLAAEVLMSAAFEATDRARFLAYITALEIIADRGTRSAVLQEVVNAALSDLEEVWDDLADAEYQSFKSGLAGLRKQSISQAIRGLGADLDGQSIPGLDGEAPRDFLARCYRARSTMVHDGEMSDFDLRALGGPLRSLVQAILIKEMAGAD